MKFVNHRTLHYAEAILTPTEIEQVCSTYAIIEKLYRKMNSIIDEEDDLPTPYYNSDGYEANHYDLDDVLGYLNMFLTEKPIHIDYGEVNTDDFIEAEEL